MKKTVFFMVMLLFAGVASSQEAANWKTAVEGNPKAINFHRFTQTTIVETSTYYYGMNAIDKSVLWTIKKSEKMAALQAASTAATLTGSTDVTKGLNLEEYFDIPSTQFASICNNLIDVTTGKIVLGEGNNPYKSYIDNDLVPELNLLLFKVKDEDGSQKLYAIDVATNQIVWSTKLADASMAKDAMKIFSKANGLDALTLNVFKPAATATGDIIYNNNGKLALLNGKTGAILWENDCNPGTFFLNQDQKVILAVEKRSAASNMMSLTGPKPFTKKVVAIDATTGKNIWNQPLELEGAYKMHKLFDQNQVIFAYKDGLNIYDIATGQKVWKKDFEADNLKSMSFCSDGLEVQFANKIMAVDLKTGKKAWKKPIELDDVDEKTSASIVKVYKNTKVYVNSKIITVYDLNKGKCKWGIFTGPEALQAFDDENGKIVLIHGKKVYILDPDNQDKRPKAIDFKLENPEEVSGCDFRPEGYFIYGQKEYALISKDGNLIEHKEYKQLKGKQGLRAGLFAAKFVSGMLAVRTEHTDNSGNVKSTTGAFVDAETAKQMEEAYYAQVAFTKALKENDKKRRAARMDNNFAYFLKGEKTDAAEVISLVIVEKNTGKEIKTIDFSNDRDVIYEIDSSNGMLYFLDNGEFKAMNI